MTWSDLIHRGHYQTTIRLPERLMRELDAAFRLDRVVFSQLVCDALEHYANCPVDSPGERLEKLEVKVQENRHRVLKLESESQE